MMEALWHDFQSAGRALLRRRASSGLAIALIALGVGMNTAVFAVLDGMVFRELAVPAPGALIHFNGIVRGQSNGVPYPILERLRERRDLFDGVSGWADTPAPVEVDGVTTIALLVRVDNDIHRTMGARARMGRLLTSEDKGPVAVISDRYWRGRLGGDPEVLRRTVRAGKLVLSIVGVMPPEFSGMNANVSWDLAVPLDVFVSLNRWPDGKARIWLDTVARLRPGVTLEFARAQIQAMWPRLLASSVPPGRSADEWASDVGGAARVESGSRGRFFWREQYERPLALLLGMAGLLLLIVSSNLATLLLARGIGRRKEMAIRLALGAGRSRLVRHAIVESVLLALCGGMLGSLLAGWSGGFAVRFLPQGNVPFEYRIGVDAHAFAFALGLSLFTALACGVVPALRTTRADVMDVVRRGDSLAPAGTTARRTLLAFQVAISSMLVTGSLLFAATLAGVAATPLGFRAEGVLAFVVQGKASGSEAGRDYFQELTRRLLALPGVEQVSLANQLPMQYATYGAGDGEISIPGGSPVVAEAHCAFPEYFATLGTPVLEGREFLARDGRVIVLNERLTRLLFGAGRPMGRTLRARRSGRAADWDVVGVVADMRYGPPRDPAAPAYYLPCLEEWSPREAGSVGMGVAVRGAGQGMDRAVRREIDALGRQFVIRSAALPDFVAQRMLRERMLAVVSSVFGAVTLAVVTAGLYGLMAFAVALRTREIAVRVALGAQSKDVRWLVAREALLVVAIGLAFGLGGAAAGMRLVGSYVFGSRTPGPALFELTALILLFAAGIAAFAPVRRAVALAPAEALRHE